MLSRGYNSALTVDRCPRPSLSQAAHAPQVGADILDLADSGSEPGVDVDVGDGPNLAAPSPARTPVASPASPPSIQAPPTPPLHPPAAPPVRPETQHFMPSTITVPGLQHIANNMCNETHTSLSHWKVFWSQLKRLESLLAMSERRSRYVATCLRGTAFESKAQWHTASYCAHVVGPW